MSMHGTLLPSVASAAISRPWRCGHRANGGRVQSGLRTVVGGEGQAEKGKQAGRWRWRSGSLARELLAEVACPPLFFLPLWAIPGGQVTDKETEAREGKLPCPGHSEEVAREGLPVGGDTERQGSMECRELFLCNVTWFLARFISLKYFLFVLRLIPLQTIT